jgi:glucoamylase
MPLMWAHAEYVKLLRSAHGGRVFDRIPAVVERYQGAGRPQPIEVCSFKLRARAVRPEAILRVQASAVFRLRWTADEWAVVTDTASTSTALGIDFVDIPIARDQIAPIRFTFFWPQADRWEGPDFVVNVERRSGCNSG